MTQLLYIVWDINPEMFTIPGIDWPIRWYGFLFAMAFLFSQWIMSRVFRAELRAQKDLDLLTLYVIAGTVLGARLGHCLFYDPDYYLSHPLDILKIYEGGLASHGGAIGILTALYLYSRKTKENVLWILDRITLVVPLSAMFIRLGNLMNSEIIGKVSGSDYGFKFIRSAEDAYTYANVGIDAVPARHPSQLYEAVFFAVLSLVMLYLWKNKREKLTQGFSIGLLLIIVFSFRFLIEFTKMPQEAFEETLPLNMGQMLSFPFIVIGVFLIRIGLKKKMYHELPMGKK